MALAEASAEAVVRVPDNHPLRQPDAFNPADLNAAQPKNKLLQGLLDNPLWIFGALRLVAPVFHIPFASWTIVTRFDHVEELMADGRSFPVPWREKMRSLNDGGSIFVLGEDDPPTHGTAQRQLMAAFRHEDAAEAGRLAARHAQAIVDAYRGRVLDAVEGLITRVPTLLCRDLFGIPIPAGEAAEAEFGRWTLAMSTYLFADPGGEPAYERAARAAAARIRPLLERAITEAKSGTAPPDTIVGRLVAMRPGGVALADDVIRGHLLGMVTGFVPTNTMSAGHMLDALVGTGRFLSWPRGRFQRPVRAALDARDDALLTRCLLETLRFWPIGPGAFRRCARDHTFENGGFAGRGPKTVRAGSNVLASTQAAMFDRRRVGRPYAFDPDRPPAERMLFGSGAHVCIGLRIAQAQIPATLKPLLREEPRRLGPLTRLGPFPAHLKVSYGRKKRPDGGTAAP